MKRPVTVSIGIPAYNEATNIKNVLLSLLKQKEQGFVLKEILVMSDGSSDTTEQVVKEVNDKRIKFFDDHKRLGKSARLDQIFRRFSSDVLILADADILIKDDKLIATTLNRANLSQSGLAGVNALPMLAQTFMEQTLEAGVMVMKEVSKRINNGNNYLSFKGCFLALDGQLAKKIHMPASIVNNDAFLYFAAKKYGYTPTYVEESIVYYRSPMTLADHLKQSSRFMTSKEELAKHFTFDMNKEYALPQAIVLKSTAKTLLTRPFSTASYLAINVISKLKKQRGIKSTWKIASSTKGEMKSI
jgi:glycosyltransferase involved in cell wall biosynthesis